MLSLRFLNFFFKAMHFKKELELVERNIAFNVRFHAGFRKTKAFQRLETEFLHLVTLPLRTPVFLV